MRTARTKTLVICAMLIALGVVLSAVIEIPLIPAAPFLKYDPSGAVMQLAALLYGPVYGSIVAVITCLIHGSADGPIGIIMNILGSLFAVIPAGLLYSKILRPAKENPERAQEQGALDKGILRRTAIALGIGAVSMVAGSILSNLIFTPLYMGVSSAQVATMIVPVLLPFNVAKAVLNAILTFIIFQALRKQLS